MLMFGPEAASRKRAERAIFPPINPTSLVGLGLEKECLELGLQMLTSMLASMERLQPEGMPVQNKYKTKR